MGKKDNKQRSHSKSKGKVGKFNKKGGDFRGKSNGKKEHNKQGRMISKPNEQRNRSQERPQGKKDKKFKKEKGGQFSNLVGKSVFKIIPQGQDDQAQDKFAALNGAQQEDQQNYQQVEVDENQYHPQQYGDGEDYQIDEEEGQQPEQQDYPQEQDQNQFQGNEANQQDQYAEGELQDEAEYQQENQEGAKNQGQEEAVLIDDEESDQNVDISVINLRIQETLQVLMNINKLGQGKPRKYYVDKLKSYVHRYYGYNFELIDHFLNFLNPAQMIQFFEANETQRPLTIRTNTLKIRRKQLAQFLIQRGVNLDPLAQWSKVGIKIYDTKVPIGATPEYLAGYYMLQSASSFLPVLALDPKMNEKILDMASAPGGKTSYIAQLMKNTGAIFANDLKKQRLKALQFNLFRLGISNTVVTCRDGRKYPQIFPNTFDRVLLDAPCTGLGIISKDPSIKANRVLLDIYKNSHVQKQLLLAAIDCTKVGGVIVYSTCSVSPLQNQQVINYALKKRHVKIVDIDDLVQVGDAGLIKFIDKRYHLDLKKTKRIYPHVHNMDGFYLGKLVKIANGKKQSPKEEGTQQVQQQ